MRINELRLLAFGPFTAATLDLQNGNEGLHLIYGPNEAGKSSALRALGDLLFGFPTRSPDAFVHAYPKLRLGAALQLKDGTQLEFIRRKANAKSLRAPDDKTPLDESSLAPFLTGLDRTTFESMHGLDHTRLLEGGELIAQGKGHLGELLFATGTGLGNIHEVQEAIAADLESLYKPSGRNPKLNRHLTDYAALRKELKQEHLIADSWNAHHAKLAELRSRLADLDKSIESTQLDIAKTKRMEASIPLFRRRQQLVDELKEYQDIVAIEPSTLSAVTEALVKLQDASRKVEQANKAIDALEAKPRTEKEPNVLLDERSLIEELHRNYGSHQKAIADRSELLTELRITQEQAMSVFSRLGLSEQPNDLQSLQIPADKVAWIRELGGHYQVLIERQKAIQSSINKTSATIERIQANAESATVPDQLEEARQSLRRLQETKGIEDQLSAIVTEKRQVESQLEHRVARLQGLMDSCEALHLRSTPAIETIDQYETRFRKLEQDRDTISAKIQDSEDQARTAQSELDRLDKQFDIPTEEDLAAARDERDRLLDQLVQILNLGAASNDSAKRAELTESLESQRELLSEYQQQTNHADRLADRLRLESDRVAQKSQLTADLARLEQQISSERSRAESVSEELEKTRAEWTKEWAELHDAPRTPREMRAWLGDFHQLAQLSLELTHTVEEEQRIESEKDVARKQLTQLVQLLNAAPDGETSSIIESLERCEALIARYDSLELQQRNSIKELANHQSELAEQNASLVEVEKDLTGWRRSWSDEMKRIGLDEDASLSQADSVLEILAELRQILHDEKKLQTRIDAITQDAGTFESKVQTVSARLLDGLTFDSLDDAIHALMSQLQQAQRTDQELSRAANELEERRHELKQIQDEQSMVDAAIETHMQQLRCSQISELANIAQQGVDKTRLTERLAQLDEQLIAHSGGASMEAFLKEVEAECHSADQIPTLLKKLQNDLDSTRSTRDDTLRAIEQEGHAIRMMDGGGKAAELASDVEIASAEIESMAREVVVLRMMGAMLRESINRYRDRHQDPVVRRASELFAELTQERYLRLIVDLDEQGEPTLFAIRANQERVLVPALSEGTRDQLYLSMRIAGIEQHSLQHEPIPFVLDDVLMNFDDERAKAALSVLADLSDRTQVILFTHHEHLVQLAQDTVDEQQLFVSHLDSRAQSHEPTEPFTLSSS